MFAILSRIMNNISYYDMNNGNILKEVTVNKLERIDVYEEVIVETLLNSGVILLIMSLEFARK